MKRTGQLAASLFCALSLGGVLTLFSQADADRSPHAEVRSMNLPAPENNAYLRVVPATVESGALPLADRQETAPSSGEADRAKRLILR